MTDLPFEIVIDKTKHHEASVWCTQQWSKRWSPIDNRQGTWCCFWVGTRSKQSGKYRYHFKNEDDAILFALRWS